MKITAIAVLLNIEESIEESDYLPEESANTFLMTSVITELFIAIITTTIIV